MHINNDLLFTGGKGLANSGSLLVWDLRNLNPNHPMEDKEKNQDIFSFVNCISNSGIQEQHFVLWDPKPSCAEDEHVQHGNLVSV
jgi:hypothetical protein